jgi:hypothetical protein
MVDESRLKHRSELNRYLGERVPLLSRPSAAEYDEWDPVKRHAYDLKRIGHYGPNLLIKTKALKYLRTELPITAALNEGKPRGRTGFVVSGEYHTGKTTTCLEAMKYYFQRYMRMYPGADPETSTPVVYFELPGHVTPKSVMERLCEFMEIPAGSDDATALTDRLADALMEQHTELIVIDEVQNLRGTGWMGVHAAAMLKNLLEASEGVTHVFAGQHAPQSPLLVGDVGEQILARCNPVELANYSDVSSHAPDWLGAIAAFEEQLALLNHSVGTLQPLAAYIFARTNGNISFLNQLVARAAVRVLSVPHSADSEVLDKAVLERTYVADKAPNHGRPFDD